MTQTKPRWYDNKTVVVVWLILFCPVGLYALWKNRSFTVKTKWILTGVVVLVCLAVGVQEPADQQIAVAPPEIPSEEGTSQEPVDRQVVASESKEPEEKQRLIPAHPAVTARQVTTCELTATTG